MANNDHGTPQPLAIFLVSPAGWGRAPALPVVRS
jgi:hypothetical protein